MSKLLPQQTFHDVVYGGLNEECCFEEIQSSSDGKSTTTTLKRNFRDDLLHQLAEHNKRRLIDDGIQAYLNEDVTTIPASHTHHEEFLQHLAEQDDKQAPIETDHDRDESGTEMTPARRLHRYMEGFYIQYHGHPRSPSNDEQEPSDLMLETNHPSSSNNPGAQTLPIGDDDKERFRQRVGESHEEYERRIHEMNAMDE